MTESITERLRLRTMLESDITGLLTIFSDPKVASAFQITPFDLNQMEKWLQRNLDHQSRYQYGLFTVTLKESEEIIGDCGLERMTIGGKDVVELGYDFRSNHWNKGYATEAAIAVRDYAFKELGLSEIVSLIRVGNDASKRVAEKVGMKFSTQLVLDGRKYLIFSVKSNRGK